MSHPQLPVAAAPQESRPSFHPDELQCELFRMDVTVLCLPRMAYHWYPKIVADLEVHIPTLLDPPL